MHQQKPLKTYMCSRHYVNETKTPSTEILTEVCQKPACINSVIVKSISVSFRTKITEIVHSLKIRTSQRTCWICATPNQCSPQWHSRNPPQLKLPSWTGVLCQSLCPAQLLSHLSLLLCSLQHEYLDSISHSVEKKKKKSATFYPFMFLISVQISCTLWLWVYNQKKSYRYSSCHGHTKAIFSSNNCIWQNQLI